jgi:hypothetical protein
MFDVNGPPFRVIRYRQIFTIKLLKERGIILHASVIIILIYLEIKIKIYNSRVHI